MSSDPLSKPPYLDWTLDRWKIGTILLVFGGLVISSWAGPTDEPVGASAQAVLLQPTLPALAMAAASTPPTPGLVATAAGTPEPAGSPVTSATRAPEGASPGAAPLVPESAGGNAQTTPSPTPMASPTATATATPTESPTPTGPVLPLTLASVSPNAIVASDSIRLLAGTAAANTLVEVRDQTFAVVADTSLSPSVPEETALGVAMVDDDGLWQLGPFEPLAPGQHVLSIYQLDDQGTIQSVSSPVVVTVLEPGDEGPLSLATPTIRYPVTGARMRSGPITLVGTGLPGMTVRLYLENRQVAEGVVSAREEWRLTPDTELAPGVYTARVAALNPQGEVVAESAPVVFVVQEAPLSESRPAPLPSPSLPLTVSSLAFGDRRRQTLVVRGRATPHAGVSAWVDGQPLRVANVLTDGGWQVWLFHDEEWSDETLVEIRTSFGERLVAEADGYDAAALAPSYAPMLLAPLPGDVLTTRRPLLMGLAQPSSEVAVMVNNRLVARVVADRQGLWAHQLVDPLPSGYSTLTAAVEGTWTKPDMKGRPVVVTVAPRL